MEGSTELAIALSSGKENLLRRIYEEKTLITKPLKNLHNKKLGKKRCIFEKNPETLNLELNNVFGIISEHTFWTFANVFAGFRKNLFGWLYNKPIFEMNSHMVFLNEKHVIDFARKL